MSGKVIFTDQPQAHQTAETTALLLNKNVLASVRMRFTMATMIIWEKANENILHHAKLYVL
jgi:hypothetical protein